MKIKEGFILKQLAGSNLVIPLGYNVSQFSSVIKLTETGAFLWSQLTTDKTVNELVTALTSEFEVDAQKAESDILRFIEKLKSADLIEE